MANKISQLLAASTPLAGTELVWIEQGGVPRRVTVGGLPVASHSHSDYVPKSYSNLVFQWVNGGLIVRTLDNNGDFIFQARSSGHAVRFGVEHGAPGLIGTAAGWRINGQDIALLQADQTWLGAQRGPRHVLGSQGSTVAWSMSSGPYGLTVTLTGNATIANPSNRPSLAAGEILSGMLTISQDSAGNRVASWGSLWRNTPTLSTAANATDCVPYVYDGSHFICGAKVTK